MKRPRDEQGKLILSYTESIISLDCDLDPETWIHVAQEFHDRTEYWYENVETGERIHQPTFYEEDNTWQSSYYKGSDL